MRGMGRERGGRSGRGKGRGRGGVGEENTKDGRQVSQEGLAHQTNFQLLGRRRFSDCLRMAVLKRNGYSRRD